MRSALDALPSISMKTRSPLPAHPLLEADYKRAAEFAKAEKSAATQRAYQSDAQVFDIWCRARGIANPMQSSPEEIAAFLASQAAGGRSSSTIGRRAAAIAYAHRAAGLSDPTQSETVRRVLRGIRRSLGSAPAQKSPATAEIIAAMMSHCPKSLTGLRDRALLTLGFAGAFRRSELVALDVDDLTFEAGGLRVRVKRSKTDQECSGQEVAIPHGRYLKPVDSLQAWLQAAQITGGPIFRPISRAQNLRGGTRLSDRGVVRLVKAYADKVGLKAHQFSGHSLRAGFVTTAAERDVGDSRIMEVTRHKDCRTVLGYIRRANALKAHAGAEFL